MGIIFRAQQPLMDSVREDLTRPHSFAEERVGFVTAKPAVAGSDIVVLAENYYPVADADYVNDPNVGARVGQEGFRKALDYALLKRCSVFHVHMHNFPARLWFSSIDLSEQMHFMPDFFKVRPELPHGALVLSPKNAAGRVWLSRDRIENIKEFNFIGSRLIIAKSAHDGSTDFYA